MKAPDCVVTTHEGRQIPFADLYGDRPIGLVFLRHLGCAFCAEMISAVQSAPQMNLVLVAMGTPSEVSEFRSKHHLSFTMLCDEGQDLYRAFGLEKAKPRQMFGPVVLVRAVGAATRGHWNHRSRTDMTQLGGAFVIRPGGSIAWEYRSKDPSDNPPVNEIGYQLSRGANGD